MKNEKDKEYSSKDTSYLFCISCGLKSILEFSKACNEGCPNCDSYKVYIYGSAKNIPESLED